MTTFLYHTDKNKPIADDDFLVALRRLGIKQGDTVFIHSDVAVFGKMAGGGKEELLGTLVEVFKKTVGPAGTIILPTFTYSFYNGEIFDTEKTKSKVGSLTEYFRKLPGVIRTLDSSHSVVIFGKRRDELAAVGKNCFGEDSIFDKLLEARGKIIIFGAPFLSCTFIHFIEQSQGVPYRRLKKYKGIIVENGIARKDTHFFNVRRSEIKIKTDLSRLEKFLLEKGYMKETVLGGGRIMVVEAEVLFREGMKLLDEDIGFFIKKIPISKCTEIIFKIRKTLGGMKRKIKKIFK